MIEQFNNKKVLFFCPKFFGYEKALAQKMMDSGAEVHFYDERMNPSSLEKILIRLNLRGFLKSKIYKYYTAILDEYEIDYFDYIIFFNPETVTTDLLKKMKNKQNKAKFILYMWDSFSNKLHSKDLISYFDKCLTFNREDADNYSMSFRPLFFIDEYNADLVSEKTDCDIDIGFIGTIHSDRYGILKQIEKWATENRLSTYFYMYFPSYIVYLKYKLEMIGKYKIKKEEFHFNSLSPKEVFSILNRCKAIVDIQHPNQTGLTMRTVEMLGMRKKIITTNLDIESYDFYNSSNILKVSRENIIISQDFLSSENFIETDARKKYSIENFLLDIIG